MMRCTDDRAHLSREHSLPVAMLRGESSLQRIDRGRIRHPDARSLCDASHRATLAPHLQHERGRHESARSGIELVAHCIEEALRHLTFCSGD